MGYKDPSHMLKYQNNWMKARRLDWLKENGPCVRCGSILNLEVDHIDPDKKVSHRIWSFNEERRKAELSKCQVLCEVCHKKKTLEDFRDKYTHCPKGHEYTPENTRLKKGTNSRMCRTCDKDYRRKRRSTGIR